MTDLGAKFGRKWNSFTVCGQVRGQGQSHSGLSTKINLPQPGLKGSNENTEGWSDDKRPSLTLPLFISGFKCGATVTSDLLGENKKTP